MFCLEHPLPLKVLLSCGLNSSCELTWVNLLLPANLMTLALVSGDPLLGGFYLGPVADRVPLPVSRSDPGLASACPLLGAILLAIVTNRVPPSATAHHGCVDASGYRLIPY